MAHGASCLITLSPQLKDYEDTFSLTGKIQNFRELLYYSDGLNSEEKRGSRWLGTAANDVSLSDFSPAATTNSPLIMLWSLANLVRLGLVAPWISK
ncbi:hypothetical protein OsJ_00973 [Oryza sativa Japonica Group]|nr:hypothetical protein OsJ_00973 [Oryza sativa Japonica Group]